MALTTQTVTGTFYYPDGTPMDGAKVLFTLSGPTSSIDDPGTLPPTSIEETCNASGVISASIWPNDLGIIPTTYNVEITYVDNITGKTLVKKVGSIRVLSEGGPYTLSLLLSAGYTAPDAVYLGILTNTQYNEILTNTIAAEDSAAAALVSATAASGSATDAEDSATAASGSATAALTSENNAAASASEAAAAVAASFDLTSSEIQQLQNIDLNTISNVQWGYLGDLDQSLATDDTVEFGSLGVGTDTPQELLHIQGTGAGFRLADSSTVYTEITTDGQGSAYYSADPANVGTGSAEHVFYIDGGTEVGRFSDLGFSAPQIFGSAATSGQLQIGSAGNAINSGLNMTLYGVAHATAASDLLIRTSTADVYRWDDSADTHIWYADAGTEAMRLSDNGLYITACNLQQATYASRALMLAANIPAPVTQMSCIHRGRVLSYVRDVDGTAATTADGTDWSPAETATLCHWGAIGDDTADDYAATQAATNWCIINKQKLYVRGGVYRLSTRVEYIALTSETEIYFIMEGEESKGVVFTVDGTENTDGAFYLEKNGFKVFLEVSNIRFRAKTNSGACGIAFHVQGVRNGSFSDFSVITHNLTFETEDRFVTSTLGVNDIATPGFWVGGIKTDYCGRVWHDALIFEGPKQNIGDVGLTPDEINDIRYHDNSAHYLSDFAIDLTDCYDALVEDNCQISQAKIGIIYASDVVLIEAGRLHAQVINVKIGVWVYRVPGAAAGVEPDLKLYAPHINYRDYGLYIEGRSNVIIKGTLFYPIDSLPGTTGHGPSEMTSIYITKSDRINISDCHFHNFRGATSWVAIHHVDVDPIPNPSDAGLLVIGNSFRGDATTLVSHQTGKGVPTIKGNHVDRTYTITNEVLNSGTRHPIDFSLYDRSVSIADPIVEFNGASVGQTYVSRDAGYRISGHVVTWWCDIRLSAKGSSTGNAFIDMSLPIPKAGTDYNGSVSYTNSFVTEAPSAGIVGADGRIQLLYRGTANNLNGFIQDTHFGNTTQLRMSGSYELPN